MSTPSKWTWTQRVGLVGGILALAAVVLRAMGRTPWGAANGPGFWVGSPRGSLTSQVLFDPSP